MNPYFRGKAIVSLSFGVFCRTLDQAGESTMLKHTATTLHKSACSRNLNFAIFSAFVEKTCINVETAGRRKVRDLKCQVFPLDKLSEISTFLPSFHYVGILLVKPKNMSNEKVWNAYLLNERTYAALNLIGCCNSTCIEFRRLYYYQSLLQQKIFGLINPLSDYLRNLHQFWHTQTVPSASPAVLTTVVRVFLGEVL